MQQHRLLLSWMFKGAGTKGSVLQSMQLSCKELKGLECTALG